MNKKINKVARTKFDMAVEMDRSNWRFLPWLHMYDIFSKAELVEEYNMYRSSKNLPLYV